MTLLLITVFLASSFLNWGLTLGAFTREFPEQRNTSVAAFTAFFSVFAVPVVLVLARPFTWRLKPLTDDERWENFQKRYPTLAVKGRSAMDE